jgi:transposase
VLVPDLPPPDEQLVADNAALRVENAALRAEVEELRASDAAVRAEHAEMKSIVAVLTGQVAQLERVIREQADEIAGLNRQAAADSSNSSRPPSSDAPWAKKPAKKRSSRSRSGRRPGKQPGSSSASRRLIGDPDERLEIRPGRCRSCDASLAEAAEHGRQRRQIVDIQPAPAPRVTEYARISKLCPCCGAVTTPGWDDASVPVEHADIVAASGSPVRIGPETLARAALLTCAHYLPVGRARDLLETLTAIDVSSGFLAAVRGRAARRLEKKFLGHLRNLLGTAPVLHADETPGRATGSLAYVHVACTEYLTLMHVGDRSAATIDAGGVLGPFTGVLVRDGYAGYEHIKAAHAWCGAHLLRDLRSISDADPDGQLWAQAMANTLLEANRAAHEAREREADRLDEATLKQIRNHYLGALARGNTDNQGEHSKLAAKARTLITRFRRFEDMILRFATDLSVPFTNNEAERACRPVKVQQRTSGGCWRTLQGLTDFAIVQSYLDTATKWGLDKLDALHQLFTTGAWLPPALKPAE